MSATTQADQAATSEPVVITVPVVAGHSTDKTVRFYTADENGQPDKKTGAAIWLFKSMIEQLGVKGDTADLTITITAVKTDPGVRINGKTAAELEAEAKAAKDAAEKIEADAKAEAEAKAKADEAAKADEPKADSKGKK